MTKRRSSRRLRTRGRRDISQLAHLPMIEHVYELPNELCQCPTCQQQREQIGAAIDDWLPDRWKKTSSTPPVPSSPAQS